MESKMKHPLLKIIDFQKSGKAVGIYSACTANGIVLEAAMERALKTNSVLLIESTSNQVDQYGGYTNMTPRDFINYVTQLANKTGLSMNNIILGGDHLGPLTFTRYNENKAMEEAKELVRQYVLAGYTKIHIDTSMKLNDDSLTERLSDETIARRGAILCAECEKSYLELLRENPEAIHPIYIVGSEVPIPGGSQSAVETDVQVTKVSDFKKTVKAFETAFNDIGLQEAYKYVIAVVVQPGVEEKDAGCTEYNREKAKDLMQSISAYPNLIFEGHSTDYQTKVKLKELVEDGVGILKVGPGLTYAMREGLFALSFIEDELYSQTNVKTSNFRTILEEAMLDNPKYWQNHYHGNESELLLKRKYSFSDRSRYYMPTDVVLEAQATMFKNLKDGIPLNLLSQFMPIEYTLVREGKLKNEPLELVKSRIKYTIDEYLYGTQQQEL
jgi:D-tagatose-1,6-bisphosphate aldolase subunit GatZ/KbaZ